MTLTVQGKFKTDLDKAVRNFHKIFLNIFIFIFFAKSSRFPRNLCYLLRNFYLYVNVVVSVAITINLGNAFPTHSNSLVWLNTRGYL